MRKFLIVTVIVLSTLLCESLFIVHEGQRGIILRFGKVLRDDNNKPIIYSPGLHTKIPIIDNIKDLDARIQTMENQADRFVTMEKKDLIVDSYIKWRISDFSRYYLTTGGGNISQAEVLLKRKFSDRLRSELGKLDVKGIVTDFRNQLMSDVRKELNNGTFENNEKTQINLTDSAIIYAAEKAENENNDLKSIINRNSMAALGIEVVDVRIKQINLPTEVYDAIYQRMRAEREAVARRHRSQGQEEAEKLRAAADYEVTCTLSRAERSALIIRGKADAETAQLYSKAFNRDPVLYDFIRSLRSYENTFNSKDDLLILNSKDHFFRFMESPEKRISLDHSH